MTNSGLMAWYITNSNDIVWTPLMPPGGIHGVTSRTGCVVLFIVPAEVEILKQG